MGDLHSRLSVALGQFGWFLKACLFRKYKKKVLLIGIDFESSLASGGLHRHRDVRLSNICSSVSGASHFTSSTSLIVRMNLDQYGYQFEDVVVMLDGGAMEDPKLAPTRRNIVKCVPQSTFLESNNIYVVKQVERDSQSHQGCATRRPFSIPL